MSKRAEEEAMKEYNHFTAENIDEVLNARHFFQKGYEQEVETGNIRRYEDEGATTL